VRFFLWSCFFLYRGKATGVWPGHSTPSSAEIWKAWSHTSTLSCFFMKWCLIKCRDLIFCRLNFLFLLADSLWPPIIYTTTAYSSLRLVFNRMFSLSLFCLTFPLFLFSTLLLFLFFPLKTQTPLCYHLRFDFFWHVYNKKLQIYAIIFSYLSVLL
jgi:hypothetical protein